MFCSKCGKEIFDEAVICPHCGVPVKNIVPIVESQPAETAEQKELKAKKRAKLFGTLSISFIFTVLLFMFSGLSTIGESAYELYDESQFVAAWVFSWVALAFGITCFVQSCKQKDLVVKYISTIIFIGSIFSFFYPLFF